MGRFVHYWSTAHPDGKIMRRDLTRTRLPFVDQSWIDGVFTPVDQRSPAMKAAIEVSDQLIAELMAADHIVIGTPMYNFSIPAALKAYIDQIVRVGVTITSGYEGLVRGKKATVVVASGGSFATGSKWESWNGASAYLKQILSFIGITDVTVMLADGTLALECGEATFTDFSARFEERLCQAAQGLERSATLSNSSGSLMASAF
jgi:FMN-dependent NADH-azoreductase